MVTVAVAMASPTAAANVLRLRIMPMHLDHGSVDAAILLGFGQ